MSGQTVGAVWKAMWGRMTAAGALTTAVGGRIYDNVPQGTAYPYLSSGDQSATEFDTKDMVGQDAQITINVWSRASGFKETETLLTLLYNMFHRKPLGTLPGGEKSFLLVCTLCNTVRDGDAYTRHGVIRFRVLTVDAA